MRYTQRVHSMQTFTSIQKTTFFTRPAHPAGAVDLVFRKSAVVAVISADPPAGSDALFPLDMMGAELSSVTSGAHGSSSFLTVSPHSAVLCEKDAPLRRITAHAEGGLQAVGGKQLLFRPRKGECAAVKKQGAVGNGNAAL